MSRDQQFKRLDEICAQVKELCKQRDVAGAVVLVDDQLVGLQLAMPDWCGALIEAGKWSVRIDPSTDEGRANALRTLDLLGKLHNLCADCSNLFGDLYESARDQVQRAGGVVMDPHGGSGTQH